ncbi:MAG: sulfur carrier protein ThiS [Terriglobales bacterium]
MRIVLNGQPVEVTGATLAGALEELQLAHQRVAVERNREMVPRRLWSETRLEAGDQLEVVQFVGGGRAA